MIRVWGLTDIGLVRKDNQDAYGTAHFAESGHTVAVVCDGMGGVKGGHLASRIAVETYIAETKKILRTDMTTTQLTQASAYAVAIANDAVYQKAQETVEYHGMGTTLVALLLQGKKATIVNVGDSRAYLIDSDGIKQVTTDHSLVQMMIARGELTPEKAKHYPGKNLITRAIGTEPQVSCDVFHRKVEKGACFLLCTDGLTNLMDDQEILFEVLHCQEKSQCCEQLLDIVKKRGAPDNVTSILVTV